MNVKFDLIIIIDCVIYRSALNVEAGIDNDE